MSWKVTEEEKFSIYKPLSLSEKELLAAINILEISENVIFDFSDLDFFDALVVLIVELHEKQQKNNKSLVVVVPSKELMHLYEEQFVVVPTISEARDYVFMEELQRNFS